jgi:enoyl-CoA hydratase/carnithine racemase
MLTGDRLTGSEAAAWGLAYRAVDSDEFEAAVEELLGRLVAKPREALARTKRLIRRSLELPLHEGLELERRTVLEHLAGETAAAGIASFAAREGS